MTTVNLFILAITSVLVLAIIAFVFVKVYEVKHRHEIFKEIAKEKQDSCKE